MPSGASATTITIGYTGDSQGYTVPSHVNRAVVEAFGASGGGLDGNVPGGLGGRAVSTLHFHNDNVRSLVIYVGGAGGAANGYGDGTVPGGFNGGGDGGHRDGLGGGNAGGGGGSTDVRWVSGFIEERVVIAGGGGGSTAASYLQYEPFFGFEEIFMLGCVGGAGGGTTGGTGYATAQPSQPGSLTATCTNPNTTGAGGSAYSPEAGESPEGGDGQPGNYPGGGGGCGWRGGEGGTSAGPSSTPSALGGSGGGGSGYTQDGQGLTSGVHGGDGQVLITFSSIDSVAVNSASANIGDVINVAASLDGYSPTGQIGFDLYGPGDPDCSGDPVFSDAQTASAAQFTSGDFTPAKSGVYRWVVSYSGDDDNDAVSTTCAGGDNSVQVAPDPPTELVSSPGSPSNINAPRIAGTAAAGSTVSIYTSSDCSGTAAATGSAADFASPGLSVSVADNSTTTFHAKAVNGGESLCSSDSVTYVEDSVAPTASIDSEPAALSNSATAQFTYSSDKAGSTFECKLDAAEFVPCPSTGITYSNLNDGTHVFAMRATDVAGNASESEGFTWTIDTVLPVVTFESKPAANSNSTSAVFTYSSSKEGSIFECNLDGAAIASCPAAGMTYPNLTDGPHTFSVKATDLAGNTGSTATYAWTISTVVPPARKPRIGAVKVTGPAEATVGKRATFRIRVTNSGNAVATGIKLAVTGKRVNLPRFLGRVAAGQSKTALVTVKLKRTGRIRIAFKVTSTNAGSRTTSKVIAVKRKR